MSAIVQLTAEVKNYDWGARGLQSKVAQYALASGPFEISENIPCAEVCMAIQFFAFGIHGVLSCGWGHTHLGPPNFCCRVEISSNTLPNAPNSLGRQFAVILGVTCHSCSRCSRFQRPLASKRIQISSWLLNFTGITQRSIKVRSISPNAKLETDNGWLR